MRVSVFVIGPLLAVGCAGGRTKTTSLCPPGHLDVNGGCTVKIALDSVGFLPARIKTATLVGLDPSFNVKRVADGSVVFSARAMGPVTADTGEQGVFVADFTQVSDEGDYYLEAESDAGPVASPSFRVANDVFDDALRTMMLGMYGQRCGASVSFAYAGNTFRHGTCHTGDAYRTHFDGLDEIKPSLRGWHDAGDYGKYVTNGAFSLGMLLQAWEQFPTTLAKLSLPIPEHGGPLPDYLAEMKWQIDWLLTTQFADGSVSHKVTALDFEALIAPESDGSQRFFAPKGSGATAELAAVLAMAARIYQPYDADYAAQCRAAAQLSYQYLQSNPRNDRPDLSSFTTGTYQIDDADPRLWAAAEIWETTGDPGALADFESRARGHSTVAPDWDWPRPGNLGLFTYLFSERDGRSPALVTSIAESAKSTASSLAQASSRHAYGRANIAYVWGSNGTVARATMALHAAYRLTADPTFLDASVRQIDHLFGRNVYNRSQVTGVGYLPPLYPHHRPSIANGFAFPGLLVGGANPAPTSWVDAQDVFQQNEIAINWNAALIYALAAFAGESPPLAGDVDAALSDATEAAPESTAMDQGTAPPPEASNPDTSPPDVGTSEEGDSADASVHPVDSVDASLDGGTIDTGYNLDVSLDSAANAGDSAVNTDEAAPIDAPPGTMSDGD